MNSNQNKMISFPSESKAVAEIIIIVTTAIITNMVKRSQDQFRNRTQITKKANTKKSNVSHLTSRLYLSPAKRFPMN